MLDTDEQDYLTCRLIGQQIRAERVKRGLPQQVLADALGVLRTSVTNMEAGRSRITVNQLIVIAECLDIATIDLIPYRWHRPASEHPERPEDI